ncbi:hypothetical protein [Victivallis sp. Marseille-Q1083]|uniref:hypothetical protein n=1 Tax=Victivallis sp. Marseille-Q1083 TaxID=2717288 RepID=UPI00158CA488|nr:hypothetical protein [Victivallis sp. Marseille-Q1083]
MDLEYLFRRRHPHYQQQLASWQRSRAAYSGGAAYIETALIKHVSEIELEYEERRHRAYYFNYPRKLARLITQYVLSVDPQRRNAAADLVEDFSRHGLRVNEVMRQFSTLLNIYGSAWLLVEMPRFSGDVDLERQQAEQLCPYAIALSPLAVPDWAFDADGKLAWALLEEQQLLNGDPFRPPRTVLRRKLWTRDRWYAFECRPRDGQICLAASGEHHLGCVPLVHAEEADGFGIAANHWFEDVVRISDAILNNESESQMNIVKQLFGLLVISESFARSARPPERRSDGEPEKFSHVLARSAAIWESPEEKGVSRYIAPGGAEVEAIRSENFNLKREMFDVVGMAVQRDSREAQTAESKAWDQQNVRQFLTCRVELLEQAELQAWQLMHRFDATVPVPDLSYNRDFSVINLKESIEGLLGLNQLKIGGAYQREVAHAAVALLEKYRKISPEAYRQVLQEIENAFPRPEADHV